MTYIEFLILAVSSIPCLEQSIEVGGRGRVDGLHGLY